MVEERTNLRIGCLNVWGLPEPIGEDVIPRMKALVGALRESHLDLIAFQEVWTGAARTVLIEGGREAGFAYHFASSAPGGGLLLLSKLPLESTHFERFEFRGDLERLDRAEYLGGKGFLAARVATPAGKLWIIDTHLHARYRDDDLPIDSAVRLAQMMQIVAFVRSQREPVIVAGDLNCETGDAEFAIWTGLSGLRDVARSPAPFTVSRSNHYKRHRRTDKRVDFVFARDGTETRLETVAHGLWMDAEFPIEGRSRPVSDHYGLAVELSVVRRDTAAVTGRSRDACTAIAARARELLRLGRAEAATRERTSTLSAGAWAAAAAIPLAFRRNQRIGRRRFLRRALVCASAMSMAPALTLVTVGQIDAPDQARAFERALERLDSIELDERQLPA